VNDLRDIEAAFEHHPDIDLVRRTSEGWMLKLTGSWLAAHYGTGDTLEAAYADASERAATIKRAA
jgi:hypothetical protein